MSRCLSVDSWSFEVPVPHQFGRRWCWESLSTVWVGWNELLNPVKDKEACPLPVLGGEGWRKCMQQTGAGQQKINYRTWRNEKGCSNKDNSEMDCQECQFPWGGNVRGKENSETVGIKRCSNNGVTGVEQSVFNDTCIHHYTFAKCCKCKLQESLGWLQKISTTTNVACGDGKVPCLEVTFDAFFRGIKQWKGSSLTPRFSGARMGLSPGTLSNGDTALNGLEGSQFTPCSPYNGTAHVVLIEHWQCLRVASKLARWQDESWDWHYYIKELLGESTCHPKVISFKN